ncbi:hypothetical protein LPJ71_008281, partial [Coemansia sp. S17]
MWRQHTAKQILRYGAAGSATVAVAYGGYSYYRQQKQSTASLLRLDRAYPQSMAHHADQLETTAMALGQRPHAFWAPPTRSEMINELKGLGRDGSPRTEQEAEFDILVIG